jgi:hypothetical protein
MRTALRAPLITLIGSGFLLLVLGGAFWTGNGFQLVGVHVALGLLLVGSLWTIALIAARADVRAATVAQAAGWGLLVLGLGLWQRDLLPGPWHWVIQVLHLVVSMGAIWWGRRLVREVRGRILARARARPESTVPAMERS